MSLISASTLSAAKRETVLSEGVEITCSNTGSLIETRMNREVALKIAVRRIEVQCRAHIQPFFKVPEIRMTYGPPPLF